MNTTMELTMGEEEILRFREGSASDKAYADKDPGDTGKPRATSTLATAIDSDEIQHLGCL